ncbi:MAG: oxidoreductase [Pseudomonadota bacterium]
MTPQAPISSGFGHSSVAAEVISGVDLSGRTAVVTGGYSGIGVETVRALAGAGARVVVPGRDEAKAREALAGVSGDVALAAMDLADLASVKAFAADIVAAGPVHLLINNAGIMACPETRIEPEGWEQQFAVNHIGHFVLTEALAPALKAANGARVVALSSSGHRITDIRWDDVHFTSEPYDKWKAYGQSKTANSLFAVELDRRMKDDGVRAFAVHPGGIQTPLQRHLPKEEMVAMGWIKENGELSDIAKEMFKTVEQGAATSVWAATAPTLDGMGGVYCEDCDIAWLAKEDAPLHAHVRPHAVNPESAERLWAMTEAMLAG